ncbi:hypothetical protein B0H14DRAFT_2624648 [Mycena olivaceomarginata]|nr:hypothetical protein B0H14DRAFT_2624648 [Mycena olivaceomarginata]
MDQKDASVMSGTDEWHNSCKELEEPERSPESSFQPLSTCAPTTLKRVNLKSRKAQDDYRVKRTEDFEARNSGPLALSATQQQTLDALRNYNNEQDLDFDEDNEIRIEDVLDGTVAAEISHGGQELLDAARAIEEEREEETRNKQFCVVYGTDTSGMTGMPEHAENARPHASKSSHLIYCEILRVFLRRFAWFIALTHRV